MPLRAERNQRSRGGVTDRHATSAQMADGRILLLNASHVPNLLRNTADHAPGLCQLFAVFADAEEVIGRDGAWHGPVLTDAAPVLIEGGVNVADVDWILACAEPLRR